MNRSMALAILVLAIASAASAQSTPTRVEIIGSYVRVSPQASNSFADINWNYKQKSGNGFGAGVNFYVLQPLSVELAYARMSSDASLVAGGTSASLSLRSLHLRPLTASVQWHPMAGSMFDVYAGGGAMYMMFGSLTDTRLGQIGIDRVQFDNRFGAMANAGIAIGFSRSLAFNFDAKYAPLKSPSRARFTSDGSQSEPLDIKVNPLLLSAGVRFRF